MEKIEQDIKPEDFKEGSVYRELVAECGPKAALILSRHHGGGRVYILSEDKLTEKGRKRSYEKQKLVSR